jgi:pimeloyl-ACP methyl ester carboxylesterase
MAWLDVDWAAHRHRRMVDGSELEYVDLSPPTPGDCGTVVFVHGLGGAWQNWLENLPYFADAGYRCVAMDLAGFGRSDVVAGEVSIGRYARSVAGLLEQLGISSAAVVGNSMGGFVALEFALQFPDLVDRLVLVSPAVFWQELRRAKPLVRLATATESTVGRALVRSEPWLARRPWLRNAALGIGGIFAPERLRPELAHELMMTGRRTPGHLPALRAMAGYPLRDELPKVACPVLIVWGEEDPLVSVRQAEGLKEALPAASLSIYPSVGHLAMVEAPELFNPEVEIFLSASVGRPSAATAAGSAGAPR